jgi:tryptophan synthase alpha chain
MSGLALLGKTFADAGRPLLVGYLPAGFPDVATSISAMLAMVEAGVDVVEVGLPYSDPLMDGPVIQDAVDASLRAGTRISDVIDIVAAVAESGAPTLVMSYWNPVVQFGVERIAGELQRSCGAGLITPDLLPEEGQLWRELSATHGLASVFLVAPSSPQARLEHVTSACSGFVYAASTMGVTGARSTVSDAAPTLVARVREVTELPIGVGLGVSTAEQAAEVAGYADAVIVGSALVRALGTGGVEGVRRLAAELAAGVRG